MVGKSRPADNAARRHDRGFFTDVQTFVRCDAQKLFEQRPDLARGLGVDTQSPAAVDLIAALLRRSASARISTKKSDSFSPSNSSSRPSSICLPCRRASKSRPLRQRGDQRDRSARSRIPARPAACARSADAPETPACAVPSAVIAPRCFIDSTQVGEQSLGALQRARVGRFEPAECFHVVHAARLEREDRLRQDRAASLRKVPGRARSLCSCAVHRRKQWPGAVRPARPARWSAAARLIFSMSNVLMPRYGSIARNARQARCRSPNARRRW